MFAFAANISMHQRNLTFFRFAVTVATLAHFHTSRLPHTHLPAGNLQLQAQVSLAPGPGLGVPCPATSLLWVGPALLYLTTSGNVMQVRGETSCRGWSVVKARGGWFWHVGRVVDVAAVTPETAAVGACTAVSGPALLCRTISGHVVQARLQTVFVGCTQRVGGGLGAWVLMAFDVVMGRLPSPRIQLLWVGHALLFGSEACGHMRWCTILTALTINFTSHIP